MLQNPGDLMQNSFYSVKRDIQSLMVAKQERGMPAAINRKCYVQVPAYGISALSVLLRPACCEWWLLGNLSCCCVARVGPDMGSEVLTTAFNIQAFSM